MTAPLKSAPPPVQPAPRRVGPVLAPPAGPALAGPGRGRARGDLPRYDPSCYLCPGNAPRERGAQPAPTRRPSPSTTTSRPCCPRAPRRGRRRGRAPRGRAGHGALPRPLLLAPPRPDARRDGRPGDPAGGRRLGREVETLGADPAIRYVQVFENKGAMMGCSNPHPHCQVWATSHVPVIPARKLETQRAHFERHGRDLLGDYLERELRDGERIVCRQRPLGGARSLLGGVALRDDARARRVASPTCRRSAARSGTRWPTSCSRLTVRYDNLFRCSFPYSMGWHGRPDRRPGPPLLAAARGLLPTAAALGHRAQVPGRLTS